MECARCNRADETQKIWIFSCSSSQSIFIYLPCLLEIYWYNSLIYLIDNTVGDCLLYHLLEHEKVVPVSREFFEIYFTTVRYLRKEAIYGRKYTREQEPELFKDNIWERLYFIYNVAKIQQPEKVFSFGFIPQGVVTTWKLPLQPWSNPPPPPPPSLKTE